MADKDNSYLSYDGLKTLVSCILSEIPIADGTTIIKNEDGTISAHTLYRPEVDKSTGNLAFSDDSPVYINGSSLIID